MLAKSELPKHTKALWQTWNMWDLNFESNMVMDPFYTKTHTHTHARACASHRLPVRAMEDEKKDAEEDALQPAWQNPRLLLVLLLPCLGLHTGHLACAAWEPQPRAATLTPFLCTLSLNLRPQSAIRLQKYILSMNPTPEPIVKSRKAGAKSLGPRTPLPKSAWVPLVLPGR